MLLSIRQDLRYSLRTMRRSRGVTAVVIAALALGIGANTAIFSLVYGVLLRPYPYPHPEQLVQLWGRMPSRNIPFHFVPYPDYAEWRSGSRSFQAISAFRLDPVNLTGKGEPRRLLSMKVNAGFFRLAGLPMRLGRGFSKEEDRPGAGSVAVLSDDCWRTDFGSDPAVIGRTLTLDGRPYTVVGVAPPGLAFVPTAALYLPLAASEVRQSEAPPISVGAFARLKPGVSLEQAQSDLDGVTEGINKRYPVGIQRSVRVWGLREFAVRNIRLSLLLVMGVAALVLAIACANIGSIMLARTAGRRREIAIRSALGAGRFRMMQQMLTESMVLSLAGGLAGILVASWCLAALAKSSLGDSHFFQETAPDGIILSFTFLLSVLTGLVCGLFPALAAAKNGASRLLRASLKEGFRGASEARSARRMREILVVSEVALTLMLLIAAGLLIRSYRRLQDVEPGFDPKGVLTAGISLPQYSYPDGGKMRSFYREFLERLEKTPGVRAAGIVNMLPLSGNNTGMTVFIEGRPAPRPGEAPIVWLRMISEGYFRAMSIPMLSGRRFSERDANGAPEVGIVNRTFARRFWPAGNPVGARFSFSPPGPEAKWITVIGVAGDVRHMSLTQEPDAELFLSYRQFPPRHASVVVRAASASSPAALLREALASVDRDLPLNDVLGMEEMCANSVAPQRMTVTATGIFAALALMLAAVGIYGVISYSVAQRTREIGVRMALGARKEEMLRMVLGRALFLALLGEIGGLAGALAFRRIMESQLYGTEPLDPFTFAVVPLILTAVALSSGYLPARRATRVDPVIALVQE